ncbi:MAG: glycosyltransferase family 4 protein [Actinobacteria bacterium]|nr:MAG: glycosyltransferase family 4 protein [Actinomycetota bacterium]
MRPLEGRTIVFVNNFAGPGLGGGEEHLLALVRATVGAGMHAHVICPKRSDLRAAAAGAGAIVAPYALEKRNVVRTASRIRKYCRRYDAAVLHTTGYLTNLLGRLAKRGGRPSLVNTVHVEPGAPRAAGGGRAAQFARDMLDRLTAHRADLVLPVSRAIAARLVELGYDPDRMQVIPNGIDTVTVNRLARGTCDLPATIADDAPLVLFAGRLEAVKDVATFVRAAALVAAERPDARFVVAGEGPLRAEA